MPDLATNCPVLFQRRWPARGLAATIAAVDADALCAEYRALRDNAPRRSLTGKRYFVGHTGVPSSSGASNRREEHTAIALWKLDRSWPLPRGGSFRLLDYQVPLKSARADGRVGKIDLLGVSDTGRLVIVELKVMAQAGGGSDSPPAALMEGLRYAAMIEADIGAIAAEASQRYAVQVSTEPPIVVLLAPNAWWRAWIDLKSAGAWGAPLARLTAALETDLGVTFDCLALADAELEYGREGRGPRFLIEPTLHPVEALQPTLPAQGQRIQPHPAARRLPSRLRHRRV